MAKVSSYFQTGILTWPKIYLYDTSNGKKLDIGLELVLKGYAIELPEDIEENRTIPGMLKDMATETDASLTSILIETKRSPKSYHIPCPASAYQLPLCLVMIILKTIYAEV